VAKTPKISKLVIPFGIERGYQKSLRDIVSRTADIIRQNIVVNLPQLVELNNAYRPKVDSNYQNDQNYQFDQTGDVGQKIADLYSATRLQLEGEVSVIEKNRLAEDISRETADWNKQQIHRVFQQGMGVDLFFSEPWLAEELKIFAINNANLITNVSDQFIAQTEATVFEGMRKGLRHEEIAKQLLGSGEDELGKVSRFRNAKTRANLIARDQVNKLNGNLTHLRQVGVGVTHYFWRDSGDSRVRATHRRFNGNRYSWKKGAGGIHPGDEIQCRCWAEPDFRGLI